MNTIDHAGTSPAPSPERGLARYTERVRHDIELVSYPARAWVPTRFTKSGAPVHQVIVVGGGQGGLAVAFGLMREKIREVLVVDENPAGFAGPWRKFARMHTLRTPKHVTGPDLGIPSLTPRAWYEAQHGEGSWEKLSLIPKESWAAYLDWYRETVGISLLPETQVGALSWNESEHAWEVPCSRAGVTYETLYARRVILATGIEGSGQWQVPPMIEQALPRTLYAHTRWDIDFEGLRGKRVAVLGCGASAFDNASVALEHGASEVRLFFRRKKLVDVNAYRWAEFVGFLRHVGDLPDEARWRFIHQISAMGQLPPTDTYKRATQHERFHLHPGTSWRAVEARGNAVVITTGDSSFETDFIIIGTGFVTDLKLRPELVHVEPFIARWSDRYAPPPHLQNDDLGRHPYLGPGFEFTEREPGAAPYLRYLYNYTFGGLASLGFGGASISGMKYSVPRVVGSITSSFFAEDSEAYFQSLCDYREREF